MALNAENQSFGFKQKKRRTEFEDYRARRTTGASKIIHLSR